MISDFHECPVCGCVCLSRRAYSDHFDPEEETVTEEQAEVTGPPYARFLGEPSYQVCPSCGYEFGLDDEPGGGRAGTSFSEHREKWLGESGVPAALFGRLPHSSHCRVDFPSRRLR